MKKGFVLRFVIYGVIVLCVLLDLHVFKGPLSRWVETKKGASLEEIEASGVVATVYGQPILRTQVDLRIKEYLWSRGWFAEALKPEQQETIFRQCLDDLIAEHLLRIKVYHNALDLPASELSFLADEKKRASQTFGDQIALDAILEERGYLEGEFDLRIQAELQQLAYLNQQISSDVSDVEIKEWLADNGEIELPAKRRARHIFFSTLNRDSREVKNRLENIFKQLQDGGKTFAELAKAYSEDERTKRRGGELGWMTADRLPNGIPLFSLPLDKAQLVKSSLGWHLIEIQDESTPQKSQYSTEEARAFLESEKRRQGLALYLKHLRTREADKVQILID